MRMTPAGARAITAKMAREISRSPAVSVGVRRALLRWGGVRIVGAVDIADRVRVTRGRVVIGEGATVGRHVYLGDEALITIGPGAAVAAHCKLETATHDIGPVARRAGTEKALPVTIGAGAWLGMGVIVLPGVTIGAGAVIAAGSVVTQDCLEAALYAGVPARWKRGPVDAWESLEVGTGGGGAARATQTTPKTAAHADAFAR